jgi:ribosome-associated protein
MNDPIESASSENPPPLEIRLDQFLQLCGVATGGQAKVLIQAGQVKLNGEVETRRRKKLSIGDEVLLDGEVYEVAFEPAEEVAAESTEQIAEKPASDKPASENAAIDSAAASQDASQ